MGRAPFIGIGPGRCGTDSLAKIVGACDRTEVTHEQFHSRWYHHDEVLDRLAFKMQTLREDDILVGEVQCQLGSHVAYLREQVPDLKVVCLHRDKDAVVQSYVGKLDYGPRFHPMFRPGDKAHFYDNGIWAQRYPIIDAHTPAQAYEFWWELYEALMGDVPEPVYHFRCEWFNDDAELGKLLDWLEVPESDRRVPEKRKWNSSEERAAAAGYPG